VIATFTLPALLRIAASMATAASSVDCDHVMTAA
jgi:hypothetical protein